MSVINQVLKDLDSREKMNDEKPVEHYAVEKKPESVDADWLRTGIWSLLAVIVLSAGTYYYVLTQQAQAPVFYQPATASLAVKKAPSEVVIEPVVAAEVGQEKIASDSADSPVAQAAVEAVDTTPEAIAYLPLKDDGKSIEPVKASAAQSAVKFEPAEIRIKKAQKKPLDKARDLITSGRLVEAESALTEIINSKKYSVNAYELLTALQLRSNRLSDASTTLNKALKIYPLNTNLNLMQARIFVNQGKYDAAISQLKKQMQSGKPSIKTMAMLAPLYQNQKDFKAAARLYQQLVAKQPNLGQNWMGLATNLDALGDHGNALKAYRRALQLGLSSTALQKYADERMRKLAQQAEVNPGT